MSEELESLKGAIKRLHGCDATHVGKHTVVESFEGEPIWAGEVEVFDLIGHVKATRAYAWRFENDQGKTEYVAVLEIPPVEDAQTAVQAYLVSIQK